MGARRTLRVSVVGIMLALSLLAGGCGGGPAGFSRHDTPGAGTAVPDGVEPATWALLTAELERVLAEYPPRQASAPPDSASSAAVLDYSTEDATLRWGLYNAGDYNQDGLVNVSDLTPLGQHYGEESPAGAGQPFPPDSLGSVIDGNADGLINISDITVIGQNFNNRVRGYRVYLSAAAADYPELALAHNGADAALLGELALSAATTPEGGGRRQFAFALAQPAEPGYYWVRPFDGEQLGTPSNALVIGDEGVNRAPIAVLSAEPSSGLVPLKVRFQAFSSGDVDGVIVRYEWDFDGAEGPDDWVDTGALGWADHVYADAGDYLPLLRVTDDGGATGTDQVLVKVRQPTPPEAQLTATPPEGGPTPLKVVYDASASSDADGAIVSYEWDFGSDGRWDFDSGLEPTTELYCYEGRTYSTTVRVTDNDGLTATAEHTVEATTARSWHTHSVIDNITVGVSASSAQTTLLDVGGQPAISYRRYKESSYYPYLEYIRGESSRGTSWHEPAVVWHLENNIVNYPSLAVVESRPAIAFYATRGGPQPETIEEGWFYIRADDDLGDKWIDPVFVNEETRGGALFVANGHPAICNGGEIARAIDTYGSEWSEIVNTGTGAFGLNYSVAEIAAYPAIATYGGDDDLHYTRALDENGDVWPIVPVVVEFAGDVGANPELVNAAGLPAIAYYDATFTALKFRRAMDPDGSTWEEPLILDVLVAPITSVTLLDGRPAIVYAINVDAPQYYALNFIAANNPEGTSWGLPMVLDPTSSVRSAQCLSFTTVDGVPAASYTASSGQYQLELMYAAYY